MPRRSRGLGGEDDRSTAGGGRSREALLEHIHKILGERITEAVQPVRDTEEKWAEGEMIKRIMRYVYNAASNVTLDDRSWREVITGFVNTAMGSYAASCQERAWFYELELGNVFSHVSWELVRACRQTSGASYEAVCELAEGEYQSYLDQTLQSKATWVAVEETFKDYAIQGKVYGALTRTYKTALDTALEDSRPLPELDRLQLFMRSWMDQSMARSWSALQSQEVERILTEATATALFKRLIAPFGDDHPFSCVPGVLIESIGRPPPNWAFIKQEVRAIFVRWRQQQSESGAKRRKRNPGGGDDDGGGMDADEGVAREQPRSVAVGRHQAEEVKAEVDEDALSADAEGHPLCTSQEDCLGCPTDSLIRHLTKEGDGDVYCSTCWSRFLEQNPSLRGLPVTEAEAMLDMRGDKYTLRT